MLIQRSALLTSTAARAIMATATLALVSVSGAPASAQFAGSNGANGGNASVGVPGIGGAGGMAGDGSYTSGAGGNGGYQTVGSAGGGSEGGTGGSPDRGSGKGGGPESGGGGGSAWPGGAGGGGGGGGGRGATITTTLTNSSTITGGTGGNGGNGASSDEFAGGGGGGGGGNGVVLSGTAIINSGTITGGNGGNGGVGTGGNYTPSFDDGTGGAGGTGILVETATGATIENSGTIAGGIGGTGNGPQGQGGVGIRGQNLTVINSGTIAGGGGANAITFTGGNNRLELRAGYIFNGNVVVQGGTGLLALGGTADSTFNVATLGPGAQYRGFTSFEKTGGSTWTLTGTTAAATPWTLSNGVLSVSQDGSLGTGALTFDGGTLQITGTSFSSTARAITWGAGGGGIDIVEAGHTFTVSQPLAGNGSLIKSGLGTLVLSGANTYSGGTLINGGTLAVSSDENLGDPAGALTFSNGTLRFNSAFDLAATRMITIAAGSGVFDTNGFDTTVRQAIAGGGVLVKDGAGTLTLSGTNTYRGGTFVAQGTLVGSATSFGTGAITNNAAVVLNQTTNATFAQAIDGTGRLTKQGGGILTLTGTSSLSGPTSVQAGQLAINGALASSAVTVANGAVVSGIGTIGGLTAQGGATVAPGSGGVGTLTVAGNVSFDAGSLYRVRVDAAGASDRIAATGAATLSGGTVAVLASPGAYNPATAYTILTANGGVTGTFADATSDLAFLTPSLGYTATAVTLTLERKVEPQEPDTPDTPEPPPTPVAFNSVAVTANQFATATAVEALGAGNPLFNVVLQQNVAGARQAFDALSGEAHASAATIGSSHAQQIQGSVLNRLRQPLGATITVPAAFAADRPGVAPAPVPVTVPSFDPRRFALWGEGFGSWGTIDRNGNAAGLDTSTGGLILGADATLDPAYRIGFAGGFSRTTFDIEGRLSSGSNESLFGTLYGAAAWGGLNLRLGASLAAHDFDVRRTVMFPGFADQTSASYDGWTAQAFGELGYRFQVGLASLEPFVGGSVLRLHTDRFVENGGAAALTGYNQSYDLGTTTVGLRAEAEVSADVPLIVRGMVGWRHAYGDVEPAALLAFSNGASVFSVSGAPVDRDALVAEAGLDWRATADVNFGVAYQGQIGSQAQEHALKGNFTWRF